MLNHSSILGDTSTLSLLHSTSTLSTKSNAIQLMKTVVQVQLYMDHTPLCSTLTNHIEPKKEPALVLAR